MSCPRFQDCESCAFYHVEEAICDICNDADQWEPDDPHALFNSLGEENVQRIPINSKCIRFKKTIKIKEAA